MFQHRVSETFGLCDFFLTIMRKYFNDYAEIYLYLSLVQIKELGRMDVSDLFERARKKENIVSNHIKSKSRRHTWSGFFFKVV